MDFCTSVIAKVENGGCLSNLDLQENKPGGEAQVAALAHPTREDPRVDAAMMRIVRIHRVLDLDNFAVDVINGMAPSMKRGRLGLVPANAAT